MKVIELNKGQVAIVDDEDFERLAQWRWFVNAYGYVVRHAKPHERTGEHGMIWMHHAMLPKKEGFEIDHKNRNPLDNRRCNLRYATRTQNKFNRGVRKDSKIGLKGVERSGSGFSSRIMIEGKRTYLGIFRTPEEAAAAYEEAARRLHGEFFYKN